MQAYTKYRLEKRRSRKRGRGAFVFIVVALLVGVGWLAWNQGWLNRFRARTKMFAATGPSYQTNVSSRATLLVGTLRTNIPVTTTNAPAGEIRSPTNFPAAKATAILEAQIALDRLAISPGSIDGVAGSQTRAAVRAFQTREGLPATGELDAATRERLPLPSASFTTNRVELVDLARLLPLSLRWLGKSEQARLDYETALELFAERGHTHPTLVKRLNPSVNWDSVLPGTAIQLPAAERIRPEAKAAFVRIRLAERTLQAFDSTNRLLAHFPCSIAARVDKRPVGELSVTVLVPNPDYLFNPENFPESAEARELGRKLRLNPGPNNPVGTAWIGLNLSGYGIHGTPRPEDVGRTESHGCFRLANWNAEYLLQLVSVGTRVMIEP